MSNRSFHMPIYCILIGLLFMSVGFNFILWHKLELLQITNNITWVTPQEMKLIQQEIERLEKQSAKNIVE